MSRRPLLNRRGLAPSRTEAFNPQISDLTTTTRVQQLLQAQRQLANLNAEQIDLSIQLMQALGGGFTPDTIASANTSPATLSH